MSDQDQIAKALHRFADKINPFEEPGKDAAGGHVGCLVEAIMGTTAGLIAIASAIDEMADAIREHGNPSDTKQTEDGSIISNGRVFKP